MKKLIAFCLGACMMMSLFACGAKKITAQYPLDKYDLAAYTQPYWTGNIVYQESVMIREEADGSVPDIQLLYKADKILSVRSSDLQTEYQEGTDYTLVDGKLHVPEGSAMTRVTWEQYYPLEKTDKTMALNEAYGEGYIFFSEGSVLHEMQIAVTYTHSDAYTGTVPAYKGDSLPKTTAKIENNEPLRIVVFGDSISTGANSTSRSAVLPMAQSWFQMFESKLKADKGMSSVSLYNPSVGGKLSNWGVEEAPTAVGHGFDLCIIGFGMNDGTKKIPAEDFRKNIEAIMDTARAANPDCEFVLIATTLANPEAAKFAGNQAEYLPALLELEQEGVVVMDMTTFHADLLARKRFFDMTGNNVNHPNDFLARGYAQVLWQTVVGY